MGHQERASGEPQEAPQKISYEGLPLKSYQQRGHQAVLITCPLLLT